MQADFFAAKALLAAVFERFGLAWSVAPAQWPFLHPGRSAAVIARARRRRRARRSRCGFVGEVHPLRPQRE